MPVELTAVEADMRPGGVGGKLFCSSPHPTVEYVWCRRQNHHDGLCSAFAFKISEADEWEK
jgi:hypothetical protein